MASQPEDDAWTGDRVARWLRQVDALERQLAPVSDVLFTAAELAPGERVLDVGCGAGSTTRRAAREVGAAGEVTGIDISREMLDVAGGSPTDPGAAPIEWQQADIVDWSAPIDRYDVVLSRFGVMFFSDPGAAFANLAAATRRGGRLAMAVWAHRDQCDVFEVPLAAALAVRRGHGRADPSGLAPDDGPFSLGDRDATTRMLDASGWTDVGIAVHDLQLGLGGGVTPEEAAATAADFGPTRLALGDLDDDVHREAVAAIARTLGEHVDRAGHVVLGARVLVVTARRA